MRRAPSVLRRNNKKLSRLECSKEAPYFQRTSFDFGPSGHPWFDSRSPAQLFFRICRLSNEFPVLGGKEKFLKWVKPKLELWVGESVYLDRFLNQPRPVRLCL